MGKIVAVGKSSVLNDGIINKVLFSYSGGLRWGDGAVFRLSNSQIFRCSGILVGGGLTNWCHENRIYVFGHFNGLVVFDSLRTIISIRRALLFLDRLANLNRFFRILFISTISKIGVSTARSNEKRWLLEYFTTLRYFPFISEWVSGLLTNRAVMQSLLEDSISRCLGKDKLGLDGLRLLDGYLPTVLFFFRINNRRNIKQAICEASFLGIPTVGIVDSDGSSWGVDYPIYGGSESLCQIRFYLNIFISTILRKLYSRISLDFSIIGNDSKQKMSCDKLILQKSNQMFKIFCLFSRCYLRRKYIFDTILFRVRSLSFCFNRFKTKKYFKRIKLFFCLRFITKWLWFYIQQFNMFFILYLFTKLRAVKSNKIGLVGWSFYRRLKFLHKLWKGALLCNLNKVMGIRNRIWLERKYSGGRVFTYIARGCWQLVHYIRKLRSYRFLKLNMYNIFGTRRIARSSRLCRLKLVSWFNSSVRVGCTIYAGDCLRLFRKFNRKYYRKILLNYKLMKSRKFVLSFNWWMGEYRNMERDEKRWIILQRLYYYFLVFIFFFTCILRFVSFVRQTRVFILFYNFIRTKYSWYISLRYFKRLFRFKSYNRVNKMLVGGGLNKKIISASCFIQYSRLQRFWRFPLVLIGLAKWLIKKTTTNRRIFYFVRNFKNGRLRYLFSLRNRVLNRTNRGLKFNRIWILKYLVPLNARRYLHRRQRFLVLPRLYRGKLVHFKTSKKQMIRRLVRYACTFQYRKKKRGVRRKVKGQSVVRTGSLKDQFIDERGYKKFKKKRIQTRFPKVSK